MDSLQGALKPSQFIPREKMDEAYDELCEWTETLKSMNAKLITDAAMAWKALDRIAHHPHIAYDHPSNGNGQYGIGCADGHRCAAKIAEAALAPAAKLNEVK